MQYCLVGYSVIILNIRLRMFKNIYQNNFVKSISKFSGILDCLEDLVGDGIVLHHTKVLRKFHKKKFN